MDVVLDSRWPGAPPTRAPVRVVPGMALRGRIVRVAQPVTDESPGGFWEGRAYTDPRWRDRNGRTWSSRRTARPPRDADLDSATLRVAVCNEAEWAEYMVNGTEPQIVWWHAAAVWVDQVTGA